MLIDTLTRQARYRSLSAGIAAAFDFLTSNDLTKLPEGRHEIAGDRLIAHVNRYLTKLPEQSVWESHRRYIDVQLVVTGDERIGYVPMELAPPIKTVYDEVRDVQFYDPGTETLRLPAGQFAIFFPEDIHAPGLANGSPSPVLKIVMKVAID